MAANVVNIIPQNMSAETNFDAEPSIAVNPANPQEIVISTFTPDTGPMVKSITGGEQRSQPAARSCCRLSDFRPPQLSYLPPPLTGVSARIDSSRPTVWSVSGQLRFPLATRVLGPGCQVIKTVARNTRRRFQQGQAAVGHRRRRRSRPATRR